MTTETLEVRRVIRATPARVFEAWTTPAQLLKWWGPEGVACTHAEVDLRVGGALRLDNALPTGETVIIRGEFLEVEIPRRLVYTWRTQDDASDEQVTVTFEPAGAGCEVVVLHERIPTRALRDGHLHGWTGCIDGLEALL